MLLRGIADWGAGLAMRDSSPPWWPSMRSAGSIVFEQPDVAHLPQRHEPDLRSGHERHEAGVAVLFGTALVEDPVEVAVAEALPPQALRSHVQVDEPRRIGARHAHARAGEARQVHLAQ